MKLLVNWYKVDTATHVVCMEPLIERPSCIIRAANVLSNQADKPALMIRKTAN